MVVQKLNGRPNTLTLERSLPYLRAKKPTALGFCNNIEAAQKLTQQHVAYSQEAAHPNASSRMSKSWVAAQQGDTGRPEEGTIRFCST